MTAAPLGATERAALILQLVPYLIRKGEVDVAEAAAEFDVTPERMRQIVQTLTMIGLPGEGGFFSMANDLFDIDWDLLEDRDVIAITHTVGLEGTPRLTAREAAALLAGLQLAASLPGVGESGVVQGLLAKLARGAAAPPPELLVAPAVVDDVRATVARALRAGVAVGFTYTAPGAAETRRVVDPARVLISDGQWYLQGWCHTRRAMRTFHLDRVGTVELTDIPVTHRAEPAPGLFQPGDDDTIVRVRFRAAAAPLLGDYLDGARIDEDGDTRVAHIRVADEQGIKRLAARRSGEIEVLGPPDARRAAAAWAEAGLARYH